MKRSGLFLVLLVCALLFAGCADGLSDVRSEERVSSASSAESNGAVSETEESELRFNKNEPPFATYGDFAAFMKKADGGAMVIDTDRNPETDECGWAYVSAEQASAEDALSYFKEAESNVIRDAYIRYWIVFPNGTAYGLYEPSVSALASESERDDRLFGVKCRIVDSEEGIVSGYTCGFFSKGVYSYLLHTLGTLNSVLEEVPDEELFIWIPHKPPFALSATYNELLRRADGRAVVCTFDLDENLNEVWRYRFVELADGVQTMKDNESTVILQTSPYMQNIWFYNFVIFPDGTVYGVYEPSVSARVAEVCGVDTDRDYGTIFKVDASGFEPTYEETQCFLPEGVFALLERELGEIETEENKYLFEVSEGCLSDSGNGLPFKDMESFSQVCCEAGDRYTCIQRDTDENGGVSFKSVFRWGSQAYPIWDAETVFVPTPEGCLYDGSFDLWIIVSDTTVYATYSAGAIENPPAGYESCAGQDYGAIYTIDPDAEELTYTVEYGFLGEGVADYIKVK